ncbi:MAG: bacillithiol biosynthesis deacetylase BshB1 [Planctomycetota bacterium]|nr:MAG: bacillithiol biosynthesis deacetylase BshB1 [Planctomycetota bacterium]
MANILVIGPHPDDQEAGMGGTVARLAAEGHDVLLLDVTNGEPTPLGDPETRAAEAAAAAEILSAPGRPVRRRLLGLPNRVVEHTIEARHAVAGVIREHRAQVLFVPFFEDAHPDHRAVTRIAEDARFDAKLTKTDMPGEPIYPRWLFYYYATHLRWVPNPSFLIDISDHLEAKLRAIRAYETQFVRANAHVVDWIEQGSRYFGSRMGVAAAEPFFTKEPLGLTGLAGLAV